MAANGDDGYLTGTLMFPWPVRIFVLWPLAAVQLTLLSMNYFNIIEYTVPFEEFMRWLGGWFANYLAPIEAMTRVFLSWFGFSLPKLGAHWHHVFVLLWLLLGSAARIGANVSEPTPLLSAAWMHRTITVDVPFVLWAGVCALGAGIASGMHPIASTAVMMWALSSVAAFAAGILVVSAVGVRSSAAGALLIMLLLLVMVFSRDLGVSFVSNKSFVPDLVWFVGIVGLLSLVLGLSLAEGLKRLNNPATAFGLDILGSYVIALTFAAIFGKYSSG